MSLSFNNEYQNVLDPETDPLEITEEIYIKHEKIDDIKEEIYIKDEKIDDIKEEIYIKDEKIDDIKEELADIVSNVEIDNPINSHVGIQKERNIISDSVSLSDQLDKHVTSASNVLKNKPTQLTALSTNCKSIKIVRLKNNFINSVIDKTKKNDTCKCMTSIEYFCIKCNKAFFYSKDKNACSDCDTLLKLQCKMCHKRYKILNTVNQVLQSNKEVSVSNSTNQNVISSSAKMKTLFCSKCIFNTKFESVLKKHMDCFHNEDADKYMELCCPNCFRTCKEVSYGGLKQICEVCAEEMAYRCIFCKKMYKVLKNMRHHVTSVCWHCINSDLLICSQCPFKADSQSRLAFHEKAHHKIMICANCNKVFVGTIKLQEHILQACDISATLNIDKSCTPVTEDVNEAMSDEDTNLLDRLKVNKIVKKSVLSSKTKLMPKSACNKKQFSSSQEIVESSRSATSKSKNIPIKVSNKQKRLIPAAGFDRDTNLSDTSRLPESIPFLNDEDCFKIIKNDPDTIINKITVKPIKDSTSWRALIDYYCLQCDGEAKKKFSRFRPRCSNCKVKYDYRCINCEKLYGAYVSIYRHVKYECLSKQTLECPLCDFASVRKHHLITHVKTKHTVYECLQCNCRYDGYMSFKKHQKFECKIPIFLQNISDIKQLMTLYCENCFKRFKQSEEEEQLICKTCNNSMKYQCLKCNRKFNDKDIIYNHIEEGCEPICVCKMCSYKAYTQHDYDIHLKYMHTDKRCPHCGIQFKDTQIFHLHLLEEERRRKKRESELKYHTFNQPLIAAKKKVDNDKDCTLPIKREKLKSD